MLSECPFLIYFFSFCSDPSLLFINIINKQVQINTTCNCNIQMKEIEGKQINGYKIVKSIGKGKFSTVYYGENQNSMPVAVKEIKIFDMMDPKQRQKCLKEVQLMKPLQHPNIIQYLDSFTYNNQLIIITEWASKGDLKKVIKYHIEEEIPIEESKIWEYIIQISSALKHMHQKKIMHRDLKPANIFVSHDNSLKIGDLGLGRAFTSQTLEAHSKVGTPLYMAPQLLSGEGYQFNADVWSLGCIVYQLAELRSPFRNQNQKMSLMDLFNNITRGQYKPVSKKYSPQLIELISKTILVNPNKRLNSTQVFEIAQQNFSKCNNGLKIDCSIAMDDIINKLNLLDYSGFCKISGHKPMHKLYFALEDKAPDHAQFYLFLEICYWLMNLSKLDKNKQKAVTQAKPMIDWRSPTDACNKFIKDVTAFGIRSEIEPKSILQSYGQGPCFLLNQLLNRQLIRINFKFQPAGEVQIPQQKDEQMQEVDEDDRLFKNEPDLQEDIEQTHDFERSMVFKRGARKPGAGNTKLLEKIKEIDQQDFNIIYSKVDPADWQTQMIRVEKKLGDLSQHLKQAKKKSSFQNFERTRSITPRINEYTKFLKPLLYRLYSQVDSDIVTIHKGQQRVNYSISDIKLQYAQQNKQQKILNNQVSKLSQQKQIQSTELERIEGRIQQIIRLSNNESNNSHSQSVIKVKNAISVVKKDIKAADISIELLSWQIRQFVRRQKQIERQFEIEGQIQEL